MKEKRLQIKLVIIDFIHEICSQYLIIIDSIATTNNSQITVYHIPSHNNKGSTNHNNGNVTVVGIIQNKRSFLFEISFSFQNNFAI